MDAPVVAVPSPTLTAQVDEEAPPEGTTAAANVPQSVVQRRVVPDLPCIFVIHRLMGTHGEQSLHVMYPLHFRAGALFSLMVSLLWVLHFFIKVFPLAIQASEGPCRFSDDQLRQNSIVLFAYFVCFAVVRICIFFPGVAARVAEIQMGYQGIWRMYALHMILHGPLYIFGIGSVLFGFQLLMSPKCERDPETPELHLKLGWYASFSCGVFAVCLILAFFHSRLISRAAQYEEETKRKAPDGTIEKFLTYTYKGNEELFGDEDGKTYPGECPICLSEWEDDDAISITPCGHSFHKECIGHWIKSERTCAFCRQDVVTCPGRSTSRVVPASRAGRSASTAPAPPMVESRLVEAADETLREGSEALPEAQVIGLSAAEGDDTSNVEEATDEGLSVQDVGETTI